MIEADQYQSMKALQTSSGMDSSSNSYPQRPGQSDCAYYLRFGSCKYGGLCRFNHPTLDDLMEKLHVSSPVHEKEELPDRPGQPECQFYMKTGTCKFGAQCKYHHPQQNGLANGHPRLNVLGLPVRLGEKSCTFYLRTGSCKFGMACKFHHPEPASFLNMAPSSTVYPSGMPPHVPYQAGLHSWQTAGGPTYMPGSALPGSSPYMPIFLPPQNISLPVWSTYQGQGGGQPFVGGSAPDSAPRSKNAISGGSSYVYPAGWGSVAAAPVPSPQQLDFFLPERPGQPDCHHFIKTGHCKFGPNCRYHHPKNTAPSSMPPSLSIMGLPLRPGQPLCTFYLKNGICKFGPTCKFDHPIGPQYVPSAYAVNVPFPTVSSSSSMSLEGSQEVPLDRLKEPSKGQDEPSKHSDPTSVDKANGDSGCFASHETSRDSEHPSV